MSQPAVQDVKASVITWLIPFQNISLNRLKVGLFEKNSGYLSSKQEFTTKTSAFFSAIRIDSMNLNFNEESGPKF